MFRKLRDAAPASRVQPPGSMRNMPGYEALHADPGEAVPHEVMRRLADALGVDIDDLVPAADCTGPGLGASLCAAVGLRLLHSHKSAALLHLR